jgi:serine/threonine protein phosphatase PrpC/flagellar basal body-associated protein FliL
LAIKQLRLDVAQLTDVGRKREHNEDNMAYVIPKDPQVMTKKGALFIVADGMGGHAAGEVASEIAVDTVSNVYYQDDSEDVAVSLLLAIKHANAAIHQRAAEHVSRSGMGTTCVTAVLRGDMAYIANVGDSRAYLIRGGQVKQVSQDHSWVAEQVRAGILTEDQARTHAQRNVITRCLGTQADVEIDVFAEPIVEGDSLVLCTDGLSGLISEDDLQRIVYQFVPQESVYHLVERANENGGPDNITAIVMRVQEVGREPPSSYRPVPVDGRETAGDTRTTAPLTTTPLAFPVRTSNSHGGPLHIASGPLVSPESDTAPQPIMQASQRGHGRFFYPTLALIVLLLMTMVGGGAYTFFHLNPGPDVALSLRQAQTLITQARTEVNANPAAALQHLASAQKTLQGLPTNALTNAQRTQVTDLLQGELTTTTKAAIQSYNQHFLVTVLPCPSVSTVATINDGSTGTHAQRLASVQNVTYAMGQDKKLYQLKQLNGQISLFSPLLFANAQVVDIASNDALMIVLLQLNTSDSYYVELLVPGQSQVKAVAAIDKALLVNNEKPTLVVARDSDVYVVLTSPPAANTAQNASILDFTIDPTKNTFKPGAKATPLSVSSNIVSVAAFPNRQLLFLLADGSVQSLQLPNAGPSPAPGKTPAPTPVPTRAPAPTNVLVQSSIAPSLAVSDTAFTPMMPVPTVATPVTQAGPTQLVLSSTATLSVGLIGNVPHLYVADAANQRVLELQGVSNALTGANLTLQLVRQYASSNLLPQMKSLTVYSRGMVTYVLTQQSSSVFNLVSINMNTQAQGACV